MFAAITWVGAIAGIKRWALPGVLAILVGLAVWFAFQTQRLAADNDTLRTSVSGLTSERDKATQDLRDAEKRHREADIAAEADQVRLTELEAAVERQKGTIDALETKYGASRVSDLTRAHLGWLRDHQRP